MTLLLGDAGTGKTTLIRAAIERQPARVHCVHLPNPALTREEFLQMMAVRFGLSAEARRSKTSLLVELEELLRRRRAHGESSVLVVDEAQSVPYELLEEIRLLANIETEEEKLLTVVLAGQPELSGRLNDTALRQLKQRIALRCELRPLTRTETPAYIAGRIKAAGGVAAHLFTREAVILVHDIAAGIPRAISVIADNAMVAGFATGQRPITVALVREVCRDLDLSEGAAPATDWKPQAPPAARDQASAPSWEFVRAADSPAVAAEGDDPAEASAEGGGGEADGRERRDDGRSDPWTPPRLAESFAGTSVPVAPKRRKFLFF
jgi:general secretion pathway protein A